MDNMYEYCKGTKYHKNSYRNHCLNNIRTINCIGYYPNRLSIYIKKNPISLKDWNSRHDELYYFPNVGFIKSLYQENRMKLKNKNIFKISKVRYKLKGESKRAINIKYRYEPFS